ncbi:iron chaperone [Dyadobacter sp. CY312]|uniref:iron chaperone n=1 Tax=Dyadobacter sp. CY312 TaxID=2907303 RepID=UPI001F2494DE|nr:DUF1801 domain-containing protein [Dyadobacter sp. CY312]MCE7042842.1 DUF1801 domain-containing protein [Dyadobacter sp. CY312]
MAKTDYQDIDEYHNSFTEGIQARMQQIRGIIKTVAPEANEVISYQIPAFKIGKNFLIYYAAFAKHITLSSPWSATFLKLFETELKGFKVSKSVIQFPETDALPLDFIRRIVEFRKAEIN